MAKSVRSLMWLRSLKTTLPSYTRTLATAASAAALKETTLEDTETLESLFRRLSSLGSSKIHLGEILSDWEEKKGKRIKRRTVVGFVNEFRQLKRYTHAMQVLEWLEKRRDLSHPDDPAIHLDLLSKTEGIESAEKYFASLPKTTKKAWYGALLHCYCNDNMTEKAMAIFGKMKDLDFADTLTYNNLMCLHLRVGEPEKVPLFSHEMKEKNIKPNFHTYNFLMNSYSSLNDMDGMDGILEELKAATVKCDWMTYTNLAMVYIKTGLIEKADSALEEVEKRDYLHNSNACTMLIRLYAQTSNKSEVKRLWKHLQSTFPDITNFGYLTMLEALSRLGEIEELEKCFKQWESSFINYDIRVTNVLIYSYLSQDMAKEAKLLLDDAMKRGAKPNLRTFEAFMNFYLKNQQMDLALKNFEGACSEAKQMTWQPSEEIVSTFLKHFEEEKNIDGAERCYKSLKTIKCLNSEVCSSLLRTYVAAGLTNPDMRQRVEEDVITLSDEVEHLLKVVSPKYAFSAEHPVHVKKHFIEENVSVSEVSSGDDPGVSVMKTTTEENQSIVHS